MNSLVPLSSCVLGITQDKQTVAISSSDRTRHIYMIGTSGEGKSTLLRSLITQDAQSAGLCVIDPHGQAKDSLIDKVIADLPAHRLPDVILLDVNDFDPFGLNLFYCSDPANPREVQNTVSRVFNIFERIYSMDRTTTARINMYMHALVYLFIHNPQLTVLDIPRLLDMGQESDDLRRFLISHLPIRPDYEFTRHFWQSYFAKRNAMGRNDEVAGIFNKFRELSSALLWAVFSQNKNTVDMTRVMSERKLLMVKLNADWGDITTLIGGILIAQIKDATFSRSEDDPPFYLYVDEFQRLATRDFMQLWTEARKGNLGVTVAHQTLSQVDIDIVKTAFGARTHVYFRVTGGDAEILAKNIPIPDPRPTGQPRLEPLRTPVKEPIQYMMRKGVHPLPATRNFIDLYGKLLVDGVQQEEEAVKRYQNLADRFDYSTSKWQVTPPPLPTYPDTAKQSTLIFLNTLFYQAMMYGKEGKDPNTIPIADVIIEYFIRATNAAGTIYLSLQGLSGVTNREQRKQELQEILTSFPHCRKLHLAPYVQKKRNEERRLQLVRKYPHYHLMSISTAKYLVTYAQKELEQAAYHFDLGIPYKIQSIEQELKMLEDINAAYPEYEQSVKNIDTVLHGVMAELAIARIEEASGIMQEVAVELTSHEIEDRIANDLKSLQEFTAQVKSRNTVATISLPYPQQRELGDKIAQIHARNLADGYIRLRSDVEQEVMQRQLQPIPQPHQNGHTPQQAPLPLPIARRRK